MEAGYKGSSSGSFLFAKFIDDVAGDVMCSSSLQTPPDQGISQYVHRRI